MWLVQFCGGPPTPQKMGLTGSTAEANPADHVLLEAFALPHAKLGAGLLQVAALEAVVHHGVVVRRADGALHHLRLLATLTAGVR